VEKEVAELCSTGAYTSAIDLSSSAFMKDHRNYIDSLVVVVRGRAAV
jgi:hypothetical protein